MTVEERNGKIRGKPALPEQLDGSSIEIEDYAVGLAIWLPEKYKFPPQFCSDYFLSPGAKGVFQAIRRLEAKGQIANSILVKHELLGMQIAGVDGLTAVGGEDWLVQIADPILSGDAPNFSMLLESIEDGYGRRQLRNIAKELYQISGAPDFATGVVTSLLLKEAAQFSAAVRAPVFSIGEIEDEDDDAGVTTGFRTLDAMNSTGGYPVGQVTDICAEHKGGKSAFMICSALRQAKANYRVLYATFSDLNSKQIRRRMLKVLCGWSKPPQDELKRSAYDDTVRYLKGLSIEFYDAAALETGFDVDTFVGWLRAEHASRGYDCVFVDYAQKLTSSSRKVTNSYEELNYCSHAITRAAAITELPIVLGSQMTEGRDGEKAKTKGSRTLEEDAGWVLRLKRDNELKQMAISAPFSRFGPPGLTAKLIWEPERMSVTEKGPPVVAKGEYDPWMDE